MIQSKYYAANKGKTAGRYQFDTHLTGIGLKQLHVEFGDLMVLFWVVDHKIRNLRKKN